MKTKLGAEHLPLLDALWSVLSNEPNPVNQQIAIELLTVGHAMRSGKAKLVADGIHKHVLQIISQYGGD